MNLATASNHSESFAIGEEIAGSSQLPKFSYILSELKRAAPPLDLAFGFPHFPPPAYLMDALSGAAVECAHSYGPSRGSAPLRAAIQRQAIIECGKEVGDPLISIGVSGALTSTLCAALTTGNEVILVDPYFIQHKLLIEETGARAVLVNSYPNFRLPIDAIKSAVSKNTKAILISSPNNPTGAVYTEDEIDSVISIANQHKLLLFSDEIYRDFMFGDVQIVCPPSPLGKYPLAVVFRGFSKSHGIAGWRIGYAFGPEELLQEATNKQQIRYMCAATPLQNAVIRAVGCRHETAIQEIRRNAAFVVEELESKFHIEHPCGGFFVFPQLPFGQKGNCFFRKALNAGVGIMPGFLFSDFDSHFRISLAAETAKLLEACRLLNHLVA